MHDVVASLIDEMDSSRLRRAGIIPWGAPVPVFGDVKRSRVATMGLNPSNREFVDWDGKELYGTRRRFHTLNSLGLARWADVSYHHLKLIMQSCREYFSRNPYDRWFRVLDRLMAGIGVSYYSTSRAACHLDLIPYATAKKWTELSSSQRDLLLTASGQALANLLRDSNITTIILNGESVVRNFERLTQNHLESYEMPDWSLRRASSGDVQGRAYEGTIVAINGAVIGRRVRVIGYNHNLQSSYGITTEVTNAIANFVNQRAVGSM